MVLFVFVANAQETIDLKWKISDTLTYKTIMKDIVSEKNETLSENDSFSQKMSGLFRSMQNGLSNLKYETKLFPDKNGDIDISMILKENKSDTTQTLFSGIAKMNGNVVLRGKINSEGQLLSFYYKRAQNNLTSLLFELPKGQIKVGDKWSLKVDMISMDQNFKADTIYKKNMVELKDLIIQNGNKIAIIEYDLHEYVSGDFGNEIMSLFGEEKGKKTFMKASHKAIGKFDLEKGYWISYGGVMDIKTNFSLLGIAGNKRTEFRLEPKE